MMVALFILISLLILVILLWRIVKGHKTTPEEVFHLNARQRQIDIGVLSLLLSREEDEYLRKVFPAERFRRLKRDRISLARQYLKAIDASTGEFIRAAESVKSSMDVELARAAQEVLPLAFRVRINVRLVQFCLLLEWLFPSLSLGAPRRFDRYCDLGGKILAIEGRLQAGASAGISVR